MYAAIRTVYPFPVTANLLAPRIDEDVGHLRFAFRGCVHQSGQAVLTPGLQVGPRLDQLIRHFPGRVIALINCVHEWSPSFFVFGLDVGTGFEQKPNRLLMSSSSALHERSF